MIIIIPLSVSYCPLQSQELARFITINVSQTYVNIISIIIIIVVTTCDRSISVSGDISEDDHMTRGGVLTAQEVNVVIHTSNSHLPLTNIDTSLLR